MIDNRIELALEAMLTKTVTVEYESDGLRFSITGDLFYEPVINKYRVRVRGNTSDAVLLFPTSMVQTIVSWIIMLKADGLDQLN